MNLSDIRDCAGFLVNVDLAATAEDAAPGNGNKPAAVKPLLEVV